MQRPFLLAAAAQKWANRLLSPFSEHKCERFLCHVTSLVPLVSKDIVTNQSLLVYFCQSHGEVLESLSAIL